MTCTFFGHRNAPEAIKPLLLDILQDLIENKDTDLFYVGNNGSFDNLVSHTLKELKNKYPHINYHIVLAYLPKRRISLHLDCSNTVYPEGLETVPPKFSIAKRNRWMIDSSDYVITYVNHCYGGAAEFKALAERKGKAVINIGQL